MTVEMTFLLWSAALALAYILLQAVLAGQDHGMAYARSQRDSVREPNKWTARGNNALRNFLEIYGVSIALVVATGRSDGLCNSAPSCDHAGD